jgi:flavin-dependent dehydrogenase
VVLIDRLAAPADRIGESLPGAARRLLTDLGLWNDFLADGHAPCFARRSVWGGPEPVERDALADPDGPGWRLDRRAFEARLRAAAAARGAILLAPARAGQAEREGEGWRLRAGEHEILARLLIDAGGRASRLLRGHGARRTADDRLICAWTHAPLARAAAGIIQIESAADGWWYSAPLPDGRRVLAFHTDSDLAAAAGLAAALPTRPAWLEEAIADADFAAAAPVRLCAANGARLDRAAGPGWLAVGDAAMSFDPLSSQGLFHALYTGHRAAAGAHRLLAGDAKAGEGYADELEPVWAAYRFHRAAFYGVERRWPEAPFWRRRLLQVNRGPQSARAGAA